MQILKPYECSRCGTRNEQLRRVNKEGHRYGDYCYGCFLKSVVGCCHGNLPMLPKVEIMLIESYKLWQKVAAAAYTAAFAVGVAALCWVWRKDNYDRSDGSRKSSNTLVGQAQDKTQEDERYWATRVARPADRASHLSLVDRVQEKRSSAKKTPSI